MPRGRPKISKEQKQALRKQEKQSMQEHEIYLVCTICGSGKHITVNRPEIYTEEIKENWVCLFCKYKRR